MSRLMNCLVFLVVFCLPPSLFGQGMFRVVRKSPVPSDSQKEPTIFALSPDFSASAGTILPSNVEGLVFVQVPKPLSEPLNEGALVATSSAPPAKAKAVFYCGTMQAVVAWNGKTDDAGEQILIVSGEYVSAQTKDEAVLGIIPLPSPPLSVTRSSVDMAVAKAALEKKIEAKKPSGGTAIPVKTELKRYIVDHSVFVLEFENEEQFLADLQRSVAGIYDAGVGVETSAEDIEVIKKYVERGVRFFAFDLAPLGQWPARKMPIAFHFKSKNAYYPLAIGKIGGDGHSLVDLVVLTPGLLTLQGAFEKGKEEVPVVVKGRTSISWSTAEIESFAPEVSAFFERNELTSVHARNFLIEAENFGQFQNDFIATPTEE